MVISPDGVPSGWPNFANRPTATCTIVPVLREVLDLAAARTPGLADRLEVTTEIRAHRPGDYLCGRQWLTPDHACASRTVERADDTHDRCHDLSQIAAQRGAYRYMHADSTSVRSTGHLDDAPAGASSTSQAASSAGASTGSARTLRSTERQSIVGARSGTVLDPKLVAELLAVAARTDIAQRVLRILEPVDTDAEAQLTRRAPGWDGRATAS